MKALDKSRVSSLKVLASKNLIISAIGSIFSYLAFVLVPLNFGATECTDVFLFATAFVVALTGVVTTVFGAIMLPIYIGYLQEKDSPERSSNFASSIFRFVLIFSVLGGLFIAIFPVSLFTTISSFDSEVLVEYSQVLRYFSLVFMFTLLNEFMRVLLQAHEDFVSAAISVVLFSVVNFFCVLLLVDLIGYEGLPVGAVISRFFQFAFLVWRIKSRGIVLKTSVAQMSDMISFLKKSWSYWAASAVTMLSLFYVDFVASGLPEGNLTALSYAQKIYMLPLSFFVMPVIEVFNARMSIMYSLRDFDGLALVYAMSVKVAIFIMLPFSLFMAIEAPLITEFLLGYGAFDESGRRVTSTSLVFYSLAIPFVVIFLINGRLPVVFHKTQIPSLIGSLGYLLMVVLVRFAVDKLGYLGIPFVKLLMDSLYFFPFGLALAWFFLPALHVRDIMLECAKIVLVACVAAAFLFFFKEAMSMLSLSPLLMLVVGWFAFVFLYFLLSRIFCVQSMSLVFSYATVRR